MANRLQSKRLLRPSLFALLSAALLPLLAAGCRSNVQQDLIAREMRKQEDQIYAMEDYLAQYQQLVCKYRAENAALRRQLGGAAQPTPRTPTRARNGPAIEAPTPKTNGTRPPRDLELPEVPPLEETSSDDSNLDYFSRAAGEAASAVGQSATKSASATRRVSYEKEGEEQLIHHVWLHGEVVENDTGGGPRLVVEVEPRDAEGCATEFIGTLALMLLTRDAGGGQKNLARWDFSPEEVQSAVSAATGERVIRFYLELPPETPVSDSTTIWVRLLPHGGHKLLAHAPIDLGAPGPFSSIPTDLAPRERRRLVPAIATRDDTGPSNQSGTYPHYEYVLDDTGWTTAQPGKPANLHGDPNQANGHWRASSEPMPTAVAKNEPTGSKPSTRPTARRSKAPPATAPHGRKPDWSPDRPTDAPANDSHMATAGGQPRWSATR